jgi:hypothetical protein
MRHTIRKNIGRNLKGVKDICVEYYDPEVRALMAKGAADIVWRTAIDDFYVAVLAKLSREQKVLSRAIYEKERVRFDAIWNE